ncbi:MAG: gliding motility-associated C-terminal domain-containing protein [Flavobacteriales bacterium]
MIRLFLLFTLLSVQYWVWGQAAEVDPQVRGLNVPASGEAIIDKYHTFERAVHEMSRDEWAIFRSWEGYDESRVVAIRAAAKEKYRKEHPPKNGVKMFPPGGCDCWIEPDASYTTIGTNDWDYTAGAGADVDCSIGPVQLGWSFEFYGEQFTEIYINSKGSISFGNYIIDWTPEEFPNTTSAAGQIAGFWADSDYRATGDIKYKIEDDVAYINFIDVGYYNNNDDLMNSYQIIITASGAGVLPDEANAQLCYLNMDWAHGDLGGSSGGGGTSPATVGADAAPTTGDHIQYGRFNLLDDTYNGPYGTGPGNDDGVNWLDGKTFNMNTASSTGNTPPLPSGNPGCDTIFLCQGGDYEVDLSFLGPENDQSVEIFTNDLPGWNYVITPGTTPNILGTFTANADNIGTQEVTITATDNGQPSETTEIVLIFEVLETVIPPLEVSGNLTICAGGETTLTVEGDFDSFLWSPGSTENECTFEYGGTFYVTGFVEECEAFTYFTIDQTPYFLPDVTITPPAVCPDQTSIVLVDEDEQPLYDNYIWEADWNGGGGTIVNEDGPEVEVTSGTYRLLVESDDGCQGQRVFVIETVGSYIPEVTIDPFCNGIPDSVVFEGGYASPQEGTFLVYMSSNDPNGWGGSYLEVTINGDTDNMLIMTCFDAFEPYDFQVFAGDEVEVNFIQDPTTNVAFLDLTLYTCGFSNIFPIEELTPGIVFSGPVACTASPALGEWNQISGPDEGVFTNVDQFDTEFYPNTYGLYEICFTDETCSVDYCYDIEITETPEISLNQDEALLCDGEQFAVIADTVDIGGTATIDWPNPGSDNVAANNYSYNSNTEVTLTVTIENGCGSDEASIDIVSIYTPEPELEDDMLCDGGQVLLNPIVINEDFDEYSWTLNGNPLGVDTPEYTAVETGEYCVEVENECGTEEACADIDIVVPLTNVLDDVTADCDGDGVGVVVPDMPEDYSVTWPDGSTEFSWTVLETSAYNESEICITFTDPFNCATTEECSFLFIGVPPTINPSPVLESFLTLCPEVEYEFDLGAQNAGEYEWWIECAGENIYFDGSDDHLTLVSSALPQDCWGGELTLTGSALNPCAANGIREEWQVVMDYCEITIPNVFTPGNGDAYNPSFQIEGLEVYDDVIVRIYNRWGQVIYQSDDYQSGDWLANGVEDGTYWYTLMLPNGFDYSGTLTILR